MTSATEPKQGVCPINQEPRQKKIETKEAPQAIGPYSQAVLAGPFLYISGTLPLDPFTGLLVEETIESQAHQVFKNIEAILRYQGLDFSHVVKTEVFLKDLNDFNRMNVIYNSRFTWNVKPARQTIQAARLPMDALLEISCIALIP